MNSYAVLFPRNVWHSYSVCMNYVSDGNIALLKIIEAF